MSDPAVPDESVAHWTEGAARISGSANPLWGHVGEDPYGDLLLPTWNPHKARQHGCDGWWDRPLNLRRLTHWLPYLRSRLTRKVAWVDD